MVYCPLLDKEQGEKWAIMSVKKQVGPRGNFSYLYQGAVGFEYYLTILNVLSRHFSVFYANYG
jgi:hypothetical protein